ncbi:hypothetical protein GCM10025864_27940 [Luteimicrobium album]|uniref:Uncharacterized protein n=1 Tax=Luteimicrobium album TaxID=1054550 RepID=A0ABQ6I5H4_9MICO|nr:hypothetical protein GCM10025864_27940 [Luteimicrobium album]
MQRPAGRTEEGGEGQREDDERDARAGGVGLPAHELDEDDDPPTARPTASSRVPPTRQRRVQGRSGRPGAGAGVLTGPLSRTGPCGEEEPPATTMWDM